MGRKSLIFGSFVADIMARAPHLPAPKETVMGNGFKIGPGGKGFNQAVAAFKAGAEVKLVTKLGTDHFADCTGYHVSAGNGSVRCFYNEGV